MANFFVACPDGRRLVVRSYHGRTMTAVDGDHDPLTATARDGLAIRLSRSGAMTLVVPDRYLKWRAGAFRLTRAGQQAYYRALASAVGDLAADAALYP